MKNKSLYYEVAVIADDYVVVDMLIALSEKAS
jgi:hypothetical protein